MLRGAAAGALIRIVRVTAMTKSKRIRPKTRFKIKLYFINICTQTFHSIPMGRTRIFRKNYRNATENYNAFLSAYPDHMEASENLANVYMLSEQSEKACEIYSNIYKKFPSAFTEFEKYGMALFDTKQYQASIEMLEKALVENENSENINARLALAYQNIGDKEKSLKYFTKTFQLNPKLVALKFDFANLLGNMGKCNEAVEQYKEYLTAFPEDANAYRNLGLVYKKLDNNELALFNFEKSYSKDSSNVETKKELAYCYHKKKDYTNAIKALDEYVGVVGEEPDFEDRKWEICLS